MSVGSRQKSSKFGFRTFAKPKNSENKFVLLCQNHQNDSVQSSQSAQLPPGICMNRFKTALHIGAEPKSYFCRSCTSGSRAPISGSTSALHIGADMSIDPTSVGRESGPTWGPGQGSSLSDSQNVKKCLHIGRFRIHQFNYGYTAATAE